MAEYGSTWERVDNGGGVFTLTQHMRPIAYNDGSGNYLPMNTSFVDSGDGTRPHIVTAAPLMVSIAGDGLRRIHPTRELDRYVEVGAPYIKPAATWNKVALGAPTRSANLLTWTTAQANVYISHGGHFAKLAILLKGGWQPPNGQFAFPVGLSGLTRSGGSILRDGVPVMTVRAPHVEDFDNPLDVRSIEWDFINVSGQVYAWFQLPSLAGMNRPLIDPTLELQPDETAGMDTYIRADATITNSGSAGELDVGNTGGGVITRRALIKFDLSTLPADAVVSSAVLSLYATLDLSNNARTARVFRLKRAWVESQATWNIYSTGNNWSTAGGFHSDDCEQTDIGSRAFTASETVNAFKDFTLAPTSRAALDLGNGWLIKMDTESDDFYRFSSSGAATAANRPKFIVVYTEASGALLRRMYQHSARRRS